MSLLESFSLGSFNLNWIDLIILVTLFFYTIEGYALGFFAATLDLISFILSFTVGLALYGFFGGLIIALFPIPQGFANAIGFFIAASLVELVFTFIIKNLLIKFFLLKGAGQDENTEPLGIVNNILGIIPSTVSALILVSFILTLVLTLPLSVYLKKSISNSKIGAVLVANTQVFSKDINTVFGKAVTEGIAFLTVEPKSKETLNLNFKTTKYSVDLDSEQEMFVMVNKEREQKSLVKLYANDRLRDLAIKHCEDMLKNGYFSHYNPQGFSPFDRMGRTDINYSYAGENLAFAPNTVLAMNGLMQSPGHRENILSPNFGKIGIGAIDAGIYGKMFCQEFTD